VKNEWPLSAPSQLWATIAVMAMLGDHKHLAGQQSKAFARLLVSETISTVAIRLIDSDLTALLPRAIVNCGCSRAVAGAGKQS
jgi:hypothetical protein